jgi:uncharacterized protein
MAMLLGFNFFQWAKQLWNRALRFLGSQPMRSLPPVNNSEQKQALFTSKSIHQGARAKTPELKLEKEPKSKLEEIVVINFSTIQDLLQNFVTGTADVQGAALVSPDGLALATALPAGFDEERTAAMSASILSLGERIGQELSRGEITRILVEGDKGYSILVGCGAEGVLLILASQNARQGVLFLEVKRLAGEVRPMLGS